MWIYNESGSFFFLPANDNHWKIQIHTITLHTEIEFEIATEKQTWVFSMSFGLTNHKILQNIFTVQ